MINDNVSLERVRTIERDLVGSDLTEYSDTAEYAHSKGELFRWKHSMAKAGCDIAVGDALSTKKRNLVNVTIDSISAFGVTITNNGDGTLAINGTATSNGYFVIAKLNNLDVGRTYILNSIPVDSSVSYLYITDALHGDTTVYAYGDKEFTVPDDVSKDVYSLYISIISGNTYSNLTVKPMIREASDPAGFVPYDTASCEVTDIVSEVEENRTAIDSIVDRYENKNLIKLNCQSTTQNGVTITVNNDETITVDGTATANMSFIITGLYGYLKTGYEYILSGSEASDKLFLFITDNYYSNTYVTDSAGPVKFIVKDTTRFSNYNLYLRIIAGNTYSNVIVKPMIRYPGTSPKFAPYVVNKLFTEFNEMLLLGGAGVHNSMYRGKFLGNAVTDAQYAAIADGSFNGMWIGDYWTITNRIYRIAHFDYWLNTGDTATTKHHILLVPDSVLYIANMNDTETTSGGYALSKMRTSNLEQAKSIINSAFGSSHILNHREIFSSVVNNAYVSGGSWYDSDIDLMNEVMIFGCVIFSNILNGTNIPYIHTIDKSQLKLFAERSDIVRSNNDWWVRDVVSNSHFACVDNTGRSSYNSSFISLGIRPVFAICAA